jgi:hypothetical protein
MPGRWSFPYRQIAPLVAVAVLAGGCTSDDVTGPPAAEAGAMTVDASSGWIFVSLADSAVVAPSPSAGTSSAWDIAFNATSVMLNGGAAGPGGVTGACVCQNAGASSAEILAMTPSTELSDFESLTAPPAGASFVTDTFVPAITGWYSGAGATASADPAEVFLVRLADGTSYAKLHVTALQNSTAGSPGTVTLEYAIQADENAAFGSVETIDVDAGAGIRQVDLNAGTAGATVADWDLEIDGFTIRLNGGASGSGQAAATTAAAPFAQVATAVTFASAYRLDGFAGVFDASRWYRYNLAGDNRISPTFDVYLIKRGSLTYALQVVNYYGATGQPRQISFRFRRIG